MEKCLTYSTREKATSKLKRHLYQLYTHCRFLCEPTFTHRICYTYIIAT